MNNRINTSKSIRDIYEESRIYKDGYANIELYENDIKRSLVNQIRHCQTRYNKNLKYINRLNKRVSDNSIYYNYKNKILFSIAQEYPFLLDECIRQSHLKEMAKIVEE